MQECNLRKKHEIFEGTSSVQYIVINLEVIIEIKILKLVCKTLSLTVIDITFMI